MHPLAKQLQWYLDNDVHVDGEIIMRVIEELNKVYNESKV
jgi:hypothetical protein